MLKIYHNPRCSKSRAALAYLVEKGLKPEVRLYLKEPYTVEEMEDVLKRMNKEPQEIIRTQEKLYKSDYKGKIFNHDEWIKILLESPQLIQRPIIVNDHKAIFAVPAEEVDAIL
ncbi:arsenate reductase (glutaredoxin) [Ancylomarina sp. 16SWW S1-10-2]|uniref:arsenate reductase (glutaredoxin) n=1 Tax=Ancylomarina sp. 16SWW S1-10-2 TaxID=2499681 RepID=UPI0012AE3DAF|nr:arsenate reductase (glutaredoxin) [Ancylomarina sp. 16SWW S1-10-2]MRT92182.1 arsenate reductase (glutaredoxin) [Ancylomarina sp. 16SWW S1-10-2]